MKWDTGLAFKVVLLSSLLSACIRVSACMLCGLSRRQMTNFTPVLGKMDSQQNMFAQASLAITLPISQHGLLPSFAEKGEVQWPLCKTDLKLNQLCVSDDDTPAKASDDNMPSDASDEDIKSKLKATMIGMITWYRNTLSPIMPPNCRFLPSCSKYALQAIDEHGPYRFATFATKLKQYNAS